MNLEGVPTEADYLEIHSAFSNTDYGRTLAGRVRYEKFKPTDTTNERWVELLGPDANNLEHNLDTYYLARHFNGHTERQQPGLLDPVEQALLETGALIHDWGEGIPGLKDISYSDKSVDDEMVERRAFMGHLSAFYDGEQAIKALIYKAATNVIFNRDNRLGVIFNAVERIGYIRTGLRADEHVNDGTAPDCEEGLRWVTAEVLSNHHVTRLIALSKRYAAISHFLDLHGFYIGQAFERADPTIFYDKIDDTQAAIKEQGVRDGQEVWSAWQGDPDTETKQS